MVTIVMPEIYTHTCFIVIGKIMGGIEKVYRTIKNCETCEEKVYELKRFVKKNVFGC